MKSKTETKFAENRLGRAWLHLKCLARGGKWAWHLAGLRREIFGRSRLAALLVASLAVTLSSLADNASVASGYYTEPFRPQYHFTPEKNWMNDPNGLVYYEGEYHLFYQYNPFGNTWGHMSWGHAVSPDMVHWKHLPLALPEADGVMIFSGSAVVDWKNSSGFGKGGNPPMVAIYTGYNTTNNLQYQCIAYSNDKGRTWTKYAGNPVIDRHSTNFRDPKVQWYEPSKRWIMTVSLSAEHKVCFYGSKNLKDWTLLSQFGPVGATGGVWECPDLFELPVEGTTDKRWVLVVNMNPGSVAGGSGGQYFIGQFDGTKFVAEPDEPVLWFDYGKDCYATVSWSGIPQSDGRRLWIGWMNNWDYGQDVPTSPWRSAMTVPREIGLRKIGGGIRLVQKPVQELARLRRQEVSFAGGNSSAANSWLAKNKISGDLLELNMEFAPADSGVQGIKVFKGEKEETIIGVDRDAGRVFLDRTKSGNVGFHPQFPGVQNAPLFSRTGKVKLHIFLDASSVEVFINDGESVITDLVFPSADSRGLEFFGGDSAKIDVVQVWKLKSAWR
jgi:fructan beta-fructosidase